MILIRILVVILIIYLFIRAVRSVFRGDEVFVVSIKGGEVIVTQGQLPQSFINDSLEICQRHGISRGRISGVRCNQDIRLLFSSDIAKASHQSFRNAFEFHRFKRH